MAGEEAAEAAKWKTFIAVAGDTTDPSKVQIPDIRQWKDRKDKVPRDSRFPTVNQAQHCWHLYNSYVLCLKKSDGDEDMCKTAMYKATVACPSEWTDAWVEEREEKTYPGIN